MLRVYRECCRCRDTGGIWGGIMPSRADGTPVQGGSPEELFPYRQSIRLLLRAAEEAGVRSPYVELGFDKAAIREHSRWLGLPTAEKPELACLASRFPTGTPISVPGLERVAAAEEVVAALGFSQYRVRFHGDLARIEVPVSELGRLADEDLRRRLLDGVRAAGFRFVTLDLAGYGRGSSNPIAMEAKIDSSEL